jgi:hypothetical protein
MLTEKQKALLELYVLALEQPLEPSMRERPVIRYSR